MSRLKSGNEGNLQLVPAAETKSAALPPLPIAVGRGGGGTNAIVEYVKPTFKEDEEDLEVKLRRIIDHVPVRVSNTSGSSAGSGSGDFHQYRQMRRKEQDRLARMDVDYQKRKEVAEFNMRREERMKAAEERTAKKRSKRQKKKHKRKEKKSKGNANAGDQQKGSEPDAAQDSSDDADDSDNEELK